MVQRNFCQLSNLTVNEEFQIVPFVFFNIIKSISSVGHYYSAHYMCTKLQLIDDKFTKNVNLCISKLTQDYFINNDNIVNISVIL